MLFKTLLTGCGLALLLSGTAGAEPAIHILTTVKPLQLIAMAVVGDDPGVRVDVLLPADVSPHDYQLKPSDRAKLTGADAIFWVGPGLEVFLERALTSAKGPVVKAFQPDGYHHTDAHIWMDPLRAASIADHIADQLARLQPSRAEQLYRNAGELKHRLTVLNAELAQALKSMPTRGYVVSHDAFGGFEARYGLQHAAALSDGDERPPGPRRLAAIREAVGRGEIRCALLEPQFDRKLVQTLFAGTAVKQVTVDTLAGNIGANPQGLESFYRGLGAAFTACLQK